MPNFATYLTDQELDEPSRRAYASYVNSLPDLAVEQDRQRFRDHVARIPAPEPAPVSDIDRFRQRIAGFGESIGRALEQPVAREMLRALPPVRLAQEAQGGLLSPGGFSRAGAEAGRQLEQARATGLTRTPIAGPIIGGTLALGQATGETLGGSAEALRQRGLAGLPSAVGGTARAVLDVGNVGEQIATEAQWPTELAPGVTRRLGITPETPLLGGLQNPRVLAGLGTSAVVPATALERAGMGLAGRAVEAAGRPLLRAAEQALPAAREAIEAGAGRIARAAGAEVEPAFGVAGREAPTGRPLTTEAEAAPGRIVTAAKATDHVAQLADAIETARVAGKPTDALEGALDEARQRAGIVSEGGRYYHGTGTAFDRPLAERFDPNGLYGPGYYLTDEPRVASSYATVGHLGVARQVDLLNADLRSAEEELASLRDGPLRRYFGEADADARAARTAEDIVTMRAQRDDLLGQTAPQVRPVDVPAGLRLLDVGSDAPIADDIAAVGQRLVEVLPPQQRKALTDRLANIMSRKEPGAPLMGADLYDAVRSATNDPAAANRALAAAGFDGIRYPGGQIMAMTDDAGRPIEHTALVIFPDALGKLRNALSGEPGGITSPLARAVSPFLARAAETRGEAAFDIGAGLAGGTAGAVTAPEDATWQERAGRFAAGTALGAPGGAALRQLGRVGARAVGEDTLGAVAGAAEQGAENAARRSDWLGNLSTVGTGLGLANPASLFANFTGGVVRSAERLARTFAGETGRPLDAFTDLAAMGAEFPRALARLPEAIRQGPAAESRRLVGESVGAGLESRVARGPSDIRGIGATIGTIGIRANAATDQLIRAVNEAGGRAVAARQGLSEAEQAAAGQKAGAFATFTSGAHPSPLADMLGKTRGWLSDPEADLSKRAVGALMYTMAPYVRMPERLLRAAIGGVTDPLTQTPRWLRRWGTSDAADQAIMREARARALVGLAMDSALVAAYFSGNLSGDAPANATERRAREAAGEQWNTLRVGDVHIPLRYLGTVGQSAAALATTIDRAQAAEREGGDVVGILREGLNGAAQWTLEESYLRDIARFGGDVLEGRGADRFERSLAGVVTRPLSVVSPLTAMDPYQREAQGFAGQVQARVPFLREQLPPKIDPMTGEPVERVGSGLERALGAYGDRPTPVGREVARLEGAGNPVPVREFAREAKYAGADQSPEARRVLQEEFGRVTGQAVQGLMARPDYQALSDTQKAATLGVALRAAYQLADLRVGDRVARSPEAQADLQWARTPQYIGVRGTPDEVALQNLAIREAKNLATKYHKAYGESRGNSRLRQDAPASWLLSRRKPLRSATLTRQRASINARFGIPELEAERAPLLGAGTTPLLPASGAAATAPMVSARAVASPFTAP